MFRSALVVAAGCLALLFVTLRPAVAVPTEVEGTAGGGLAAWAFTAPNTPQFSYWYVGTQDCCCKLGEVSGLRYSVQATRIQLCPTVDQRS